MLGVTGLIVDWSHWETKAVPGRKGLLFISVPHVRQKLMTKCTFLWCCPSCKYWWAGVNMNFKHTWHRWLLPFNVKWPLANNSWCSIKESLWQAAFPLYIFVIPEWSYSLGLRWNCPGEQLPETQCSCRSVTKINCTMNVVCEPECQGEGRGRWWRAGCSWQKMFSSPGLCCSSILVIVSLPGTGHAESLHWGFLHSQWIFSLSSGSHPSANRPTLTAWMKKKDQWMVLCFLILAVSLWIFPKTVIWNKTQATLRSVQWHYSFPTKQLQSISRKTDIAPISVVLHHSAIPVQFLCINSFVFWMKHILF